MQVDRQGPRKRGAWQAFLGSAVVICLIIAGVLGLIALVRTADFALHAASEPRFALPKRESGTAALAARPPNTSQTANVAETPKPRPPPALASKAAPKDSTISERSTPTRPDGDERDAGRLVPASAFRSSATDAGVPLDGGLPQDAGVDAASIDASPTADGQANDSKQRSEAIAQFTSAFGSVLCGANTCNVGQVCCNPSCGICTAPGGTCDKRQCTNSIQYPTSQMCGMTTCNVGLVCCNASCGICVRPGEKCSQRVCD